MLQSQENLRSEGLSETVYPENLPIFNSGRESVRHSWSASAFDADFPFRAQRLAEANSGEILQQTRHKKVTLLTMPEGKFVYKSYYEKRFLRYLLRPSLALRELHGYRIIARLGLPSAEVVGISDTREGLQLRHALILTRLVEGGQDGICFLKDGLTEEQQNLHRIFMRKVIATVAFMHNAGYTHGGVHSRNFLWSGTAEDMKLVLIDLATVRRGRFGRVTRRRGMKEIDFFLRKNHVPEEHKAEYRDYYLSLRK